MSPVALIRDLRAPSKLFQRGPAWRVPFRTRCASARFATSTASFMCHQTRQLRVLVIDANTANAANAEARCALLAALRCKAVMALDGAQCIAGAAQFDLALYSATWKCRGWGDAMWLAKCEPTGRRATRDLSA